MSSNNKPAAILREQLRSMSAEEINANWAAVKAALAALGGGRNK